MTNSDPRLSAASEDDINTPDEALDLLIYQAGWIDEHGGDHHEDDCSTCRSIAMVRAGLNHAYPPSSASITASAQPTPDLLQEIHDAVNALGGRSDQDNSYDQGIVDTVSKVLDIIEARLASQPSPASTVEPFDVMATIDPDHAESFERHNGSSAATEREAALEAAALDFIAKVDRGEARSKRSYDAFKAALALSRPEHS